MAQPSHKHENAPYIADINLYLLDDQVAISCLYVARGAFQSVACRNEAIAWAMYGSESIAKSS
eukprot:scaffold77502_cov20-Prasinocladus_malaysianus.AAC.1